MPETKKYEFEFDAETLRLMSDSAKEAEFGIKISDAILDWRKNYSDTGDYVSFTSDLVPDYFEDKYFLVVNIVYEPKFVSMKEEISAAQSKVSDL